MQLDYIIIGQGICGTFLSWYLQKADKSFVVIDEMNGSSASRVAAGIINPVTGRRIVKTWMIEELLPYLQDTYKKFGEELGINAISQKNIIDFFPTPQMKISFENRLAEDVSYLNLPANPESFKEYFAYDFNYGEISPCYLVHMSEILQAWRNNLLTNKKLLEEHFDYKALKVNPDSIQYNGTHASKIIFCDGVESNNNPWFGNLPFANNKGEALLIYIMGFPSENIYKKGINLVPLANNIYWAGSSYEWEYDNDQPTQTFRQRMEQQLTHWLKKPFEIIDHLASLRPATIERRPFVGLHPRYPSIGILNGMGTKGCSIAPFFADQFVKHLTLNTPISREADVRRFSRILTRTL